jgi:hypothetical protein
MALSRDFVQDLVNAELSQITAGRAIARIRELIAPPYAVEREWLYGAPGQTYTCWIVLEHRASNTGIAYCAEGFGPGNPWGLVFLTGPRIGIGTDSEWYGTLEQAMKESMAWDEETNQ